MALAMFSCTPLIVSLILQWITHALARELRNHERAYVRSKSANTLSLVMAAITSRYELADESEAVFA